MSLPRYVTFGKLGGLLGLGFTTWAMGGAGLSGSAHPMSGAGWTGTGAVGMPGHLQEDQGHLLSSPRPQGLSWAEVFGGLGAHMSSSSFGWDIPMCTRMGLGMGTWVRQPRPSKGTPYIISEGMLPGGKGEGSGALGSAGPE